MTIVEYTDHKPSAVDFPNRIVSPTHANPCCFSCMKPVGTIQREGRWEYQYRRCSTCGYTVRFVLREVPDAALIKDLQNILANSFQRNVPDY